MTKQKRLGRGLEALLGRMPTPADVPAATQIPTPQPAPEPLESAAPEPPAWLLATVCCILAVRRCSYPLLTAIT